MAGVADAAVVLGLGLVEYFRFTEALGLPADFCLGNMEDKIVQSLKMGGKNLCGEKKKGEERRGKQAPGFNKTVVAMNVMPLQRAIFA